MRKTFMYIFMFLLSLQATEANALVVQIATGTAGTPISSPGPIMLTNLGSFKASRYAYLYTQAELTAAGITNGAVISAVGWMKNSAAPTLGGATFRIWMKNSSAAAYSAATETWANLNASTTLVYQNTNQTIPATMNPNYIDFTLNSTFTYTGGSLEVSVEWDATMVTGNPGTGELLWMWSTVVDRIYGGSNTTLTPLTSLSSTTSNTNINDQRPFIQITYTNGTGPGVPACVSAPTAPANAGTACVGATTLSWPAVTGATGYDVYLNTGATATTLVSTNQAGTSYSTTTTAGPYAWRIVPRNATGPATGCANFTFTAAASVVPTVSIAANPSGPICPGTSVTFAATPANGGTPSYQWKKGSTNVGTNSPNYTDAGLVNGDVITVVMTSNASCISTTTATSNAITMNVTNTTVTPTVSIAVNPSATICTGTSATFTATPTHGGTPSYQWKKGTTNVGTNSPTYTDAALVTGNAISVVMTSNALCISTPTATSNTITMTVNPSTIPQVTIAANPAGAICAGTPVTFTASPSVNTPTYQWKKNGGNVGTNSPTYTDAALANGSIITVTMTANVDCVSSTPVTSNPITMAVAPVVTPTVTITAIPGTSNPSGTIVTFSAALTNGGATPLYQWQKNNVNIPGASTNSYVTSAIAHGDMIRCRVIHGRSCASTDTVYSNDLFMSVSSSGIGTTSNGGGSIVLKPNPNKGTFVLEGAAIGSDHVNIEVINAIGQVIHRDKLPVTNGKLNSNVKLTNMQQGVYMLRMHTASGTEALRFVIAE